MSFWEYFRGSRDETWPQLSVHLDKGWKSPKDYKVMVSLGGCMMSPTPEEMADLIDSYNRAQEALNQYRKDVA